GRSILILCDSIGAVIMKMIRSTSITSTSGVTLISAMGPLPPPELNAILLILLQPHTGAPARGFLLLLVVALRLRNEAELHHAGVLRIGHDRGDELVLGVLVRADLQLWLRRALRSDAQLRLQRRFGDGLVVPIQLARILDRERDRLVRRLVGRLGQTRDRQLDLDL